MVLIDYFQIVDTDLLPLLALSPLSPSLVLVVSVIASVLRGRELVLRGRELVLRGRELVARKRPRHLCALWPGTNNDAVKKQDNAEKTIRKRDVATTASGTTLTRRRQRRL
jgi:hypothetical protein